MVTFSTAARNDAWKIDEHTIIAAKPTIPKIGPAYMNPIIIVDKASIFAINTYLLFSLLKNFDMYNIVIASGTTAILIIPMASTVSINFGKKIGIIFGNTKNPKSEIPIDIKIIIFFNFLLETPLESCGNKYLKDIDDNITKIVKICNDKE